MFMLRNKFVVSWELPAVCSCNNGSVTTPAAVSALASTDTMDQPPRDLAMSRLHHAMEHGKTDDLKWRLNGLSDDQKRLVREWVWESYRCADQCGRTSREFVRHMEQTLGEQIQLEVARSDLPQKHPCCCERFWGTFGSV